MKKKKAINVIISFSVFIILMIPFTVVLFHLTPECENGSFANWMVSALLIINLMFANNMASSMYRWLDKNK